MHRHIAGSLTGRVTKWIVVGFWLAVFVGAGVFAGKLDEVKNNEAVSWLPGSAESTRALERLEPFRDPNAIPTVVAYESVSGPLSDAQLAEIEAHAQEMAGLDGVEGPVISPAVAAQAGVPAVSEDGEVAQTVVTLNFGPNGWEEMPAAADELRDIAALDGVAVYITGAGGQAADQAEAFAGIDSTLLFAALSVVIVILLLTYRSPVLWLLPIVSVVVALTTSLALVYFLARYAGLTVNDQSQAILSVLVIGAGTDYALLLVARYREELRRHADRHEAMGFALHRAAPAILASASTVAVGMLCLMLAEMNSTSGLGPVAAIGIGVTYVVMVTLLPALLVVTGRWVFWPKRPSFGSAEPTTAGLWAALGQRISRAPRSVWIVTTGLLLAACLGLFRLDAGGLATDEQYTRDFESVTGQQVLIEHGLADASNPVQVVADAAYADEVAAAVAGVDSVEPPTGPVVQGDVAYITAAIPGDPLADSAYAAVEDVREAVRAVDGADALVGGFSAVYLDTKDANTRDNQVIIPAVLVVVLLILVMLLRAFTAPLILIATVVLSFGAALGIATLLFEFVFGFEGADASFPLFAFVFLVALGIDYNIFLMTRVREETQTLGTRRGSLVALASTGGVITSAGIVLAATFLVLGTLPLVFLAELGTTVALGVLLDTMVVRSVLVTAINLDLGGRIWWPSGLDRGDQEVEPAEPEREPAGV
ncbi:MMPL family transporter [Nocardioides sp. GCM10027113]|uniref:MMPL family transporter n=1 Tax=unclassified Nocardioides TaxID=2615069 RepID=UPI003612BB45